MTTAGVLIAAPRFYGEWPAWLYVAIGGVTLAVVVIAVALNRL